MIINADILEWAASYDGSPFMAVICDPPYGLNEEEIDIQAVLVDWMAGREHRPRGAGFMGRGWDAFLPGPAIWRAIRQHCHPGAFLFAFGGTRTADLLGLALRLAGWEKRDEIDWCYGAGFPKNHHIGRAIDRAAKAERPIVGTRKHQPKFDAKGFEYRKKDNGFNSKDRDTFNVTAPASDLSEAWDGHGTALKPAHEPILVFRNPFTGTYAENCIRTGAGALNIAGGRISGTKPLRETTSGNEGMFGLGSRLAAGETTEGRWPSNLILDEHTAALVGEQSGESESKRSDRGKVEIFDELYKRAPSWHGESTERGHDDSGTASRYFFQASYMYERLEAADPLFYCPKADRAEREAGLDPRQIALLGMEEVEETRRTDGRQTEHETGHLRTSPRRNTGPCIKPLKLTRYLATLLLPPDMYAPRRILCPFGGTGSEAIGAILAGWEEVVYVEREIEYVRIAEARAAYWRQRRHEFLDPSKPIEAKVSAAPTGQRDMFLEDL